MKNKLLTLKDNKQYIVVEEINYNGTNYYYIAKYENNNLTDNYKIMKLETKYGNNYAIEVGDEHLLKNIIPLLLDKLA